MALSQMPINPGASKAGIIPDPFADMASLAMPKWNETRCSGVISWQTGLTGSDLA